MSVFDKIIDLIQTKNLSYEVIEHAPVHTSMDAARVRDTDVSNGAKALVMVADKKPMLFVVPGDRKADFRKIKNSLSIKDLRMATPDEVFDITGLKVGSIPPVGKAIGLKSYFDDSFLEKEKIVFNAGLLTKSIIIKTKDLINLENPEIIEIV